jgi:very-short-patch-repair endonuclease
VGEGSAELNLPSRLREGLGEGLLDKGYKRPTRRSRELRLNQTDAERILWSRLRSKQLGGVRFNTQYPIGPFICDFVARSKGLVIELDGGQHAQTVSYDSRRTRYIEERGYRVLRFWNTDVMTNLDGVLSEIEQSLEQLGARDMSKPQGSDW